MTDIQVYEKVDDILSSLEENTADELVQYISDFVYAAEGFEREMAKSLVEETLDDLGLTITPEECEIWMLM